MIKNWNNPFGYTASWAGIARVILWTVAFIFLAGKILPPPLENIPYEKSLSGTGVTPVVTIPEDPRFVREDMADFNGTDPLIYWITDSTGAIFPPDKGIKDAQEHELDFIPTHVLKNLRRHRGAEKTHIALNMQLGLRSVESFSSILSAIAQKPDMIVMSINPAWSFNGYEIHKRKKHLNRASALWIKHPEAWSLLPFLASPANLVWAAATPLFPVLRQSGPYKAAIKKLLATSEDARQTEKVSLIEGGVVFWVCMTTGDCGALLTPSKTLNIINFYKRLIAISRHDEDNMAIATLARSLRALRDSGIPALIYMIPVPREMTTSEETRENIRNMEAHLQELQIAYRDTNIHILPKVPASVISGLSFRSDDLFHLVKHGKYDDFMARQLWPILQKRLKDKKGEAYDKKNTD